MRSKFLLFAGLSAAAIVQPHDHRHRHAKRQDVVTEFDVVTVTVMNAIVYVDAAGNPTATSMQSLTSPTSAAQQQQPDLAPAIAPTLPAMQPPEATKTSLPPPYALPTDSAPPAALPSQSAPAPPPAPAPAPASPAPAPAPPSNSAPASAPASASSSMPSYGTQRVSGYGISYSPYHNDKSCKLQAEVNKDLSVLNGYAFIRIYGTSCNQTATVLSAARAKGMQLFAGIYDVNQVDAEIQQIIDVVNGDWHGVNTISIGNEGVNDGRYTVSAVVSAIKTARQKLAAAGYRGNVVTVDTFVAIISNPALCQNSDFAAANCHAFFDPTISAPNAGNYVLNQAKRVSQACGGMDTMITESGWPWQGQQNGLAVASPQAQAAAVQSLKAAFNSNIILFDAFNDYWKTSNAQQFGAEPYWGLHGNAPT